MTEQFAAAPKVVKPKPKYKEEQQEQEEDEIKLIYNNLMWDKRIVRGNTYAAIVTSKQGDAPISNKTKQNFGQKQQQNRTDAFEGGNRRANIQIFTDQFVQTLTDKPPRYEYASQTEPLPAPKVIRYRLEQKEGQDIETQIWDNELFDFDYQAQPLLNVLCGRTLEISRMEVLQEEELRIMSNRQQELRLYQKEQNKKIQKMYEQEEKLQQENIQILQRFRKEKQNKIKTHRKVFSRVLAKQYLRDLKSNTLNIVENNGFFRNIIETRVITQVLPKFYQQTFSLSAEQQSFDEQANKLFEEAKKVIVKEHAWAKQVQRTRRKQITDKRQEKARQKIERGKMKYQQQHMRIFLEQQKIRLLKQEQERQRQAENAGKQQNGGEEN